MQRRRPPTFGEPINSSSNNHRSLFSIFNSWDRDVTLKKDRMIEMGMSSKGFVEALCSVAVYQQPSPYFSLDETLEYLLIKIMQNKQQNNEGEGIDE
jgi:hypothetical protein